MARHGRIVAEEREDRNQIRLRRVREARERFAPDGPHSDYAMGWLDALHYVEFDELPDPRSGGVDAGRVQG